MNTLSSSAPTIVVLEPGQALPPGAVLHTALQPGSAASMQAAAAHRSRLHPLLVLGAATLVAGAASGAAVWMWLKQAPPAAPPVVEVIEPAVVTPAPVAPVCRQCGRIEAINVQETRGQATGLGALGGAAAGAGLGNQFGKGNGKKAMTVLGAVGGALAGHEAEKQVRVERIWTISVRMEGGLRQTLSQNWMPNWRVGDRVRVVEGQIVSR